MEFNESTGQTEVLRHCAWLDKCIDQQPDKRHLASFISLSLYFLVPAPSLATQTFPFPCLWFLLSLLIIVLHNGKMLPSVSHVESPTSIGSFCTQPLKLPGDPLH